MPGRWLPGDKDSSESAASRDLARLLSSSTRIAAAAASSCFRDCFSRSLWRLDMLSIHFTSRSTTRFFILSRCSSFFAFCAIHCCTRASGAVSSARERFGIAAEDFEPLVDLCAKVIKREVGSKNFNVIFGLDPIGHFIGAKLAKDYFKKRFLSVRLGNQFKESGRSVREMLDIMCENDEVLFLSERRRSHEEMAQLKAKLAPKKLLSLRQFALYDLQSADYNRVFCTEVDPEKKISSLVTFRRVNRYRDN